MSDLVHGATICDEEQEQQDKTYFYGCGYSRMFSSGNAAQKTTKLLQLLQTASVETVLASCRCCRLQTPDDTSGLRTFEAAEVVCDENLGLGPQLGVTE